MKSSGNPGPTRNPPAFLPSSPGHQSQNPAEKKPKSDEIGKIGGAPPSPPPLPPKTGEGKKVESTSKGQQNGKKHQLSLSRANGKPGLETSDKSAGSQKPTEKRPKSEQIAKNRGAINVNKAAPSALPPPPPPPKKSEGNKVVTTPKDMQIGKKDQFSPSPAAKSTSPEKVKSDPKTSKSAAGQAKAPAPEVEAKPTRPQVTPASHPGRPPPPSSDAASPRPAAGPEEDPTKPTEPSPPTPEIPASVPGARVPGTANQSSPPTAFVPSIRNDDVYEFKKTDLAFENPDLMLFVRKVGGERAKGADPGKLGSRPSEVADPPPHPSAEHLRKLHLEQKLCDLTVKIPEGPSFKLHKVALTARSKKYLELFKRQQDGSRPAEIEVRDVSPAAVAVAVDYLYGRDVGLTEGNVEDVLSCALQLGTEGLAKRCGEFLKNVTADNVFDHLRIAAERGKVVSESDLGRMIDVAAEYFGRLSRTEAFLRLTVEALAVLLESEKIHDVGEDLVLRSAALWLNHDLPARSGFAAQLLSSVRLNQTSPKLIDELIDGNGELSRQPEVKGLLLEAYRYHALHPKQAEWKSTPLQPGQQVVIKVVGSKGHGRN